MPKTQREKNQHLCAAGLPFHLPHLPPLPPSTLHPISPCSGQRDMICELFQSILSPLVYSCVWLMGSTSRGSKGGVGTCSFSSLPTGSLWVDCVSLLNTTIPVRLLQSHGQPLWVPSLLPPFAHSGFRVLMDPNHCRPQSKFVFPYLCPFNCSLIKLSLIVLFECAN